MALYGFNSEALDEFMDKVASSRASEEIIRAMLEKGAPIIAKSMTAEAKAIEMNSLQKHRITGALGKSIKTTKVKVYSISKDWYIEVYPQGKNKAGKRNAMIGAIINYGREGVQLKERHIIGRMQADPWVKRAHDNAAEEAIEAMKEVFENGISK